MNNLFIQDILMQYNLDIYALRLQLAVELRWIIKFVDFIWTLIPILMIILITIPTFAILFELDKLHKILIKLVAIGNQWFWT